MTGLLNEGFEVNYNTRYPDFKSKKHNNPYRIDKDKASEIWELGNDELVKRVNLEYKNVQSNDKRKKNDPEIVKLVSDEKELKEAIEKHPNMVKLKEKQEDEKRLLEDTDEDINKNLIGLETIKQSLANERSAYQEDSKEFKGLFRLCMDEISHRIETGKLEG